MTADPSKHVPSPEGLAEIEQGAGGLAKLTLRCPAGEAEVYLHGAHVTSFVPAGGEELLWCSRKSWFQADKPIRGGVPICFPWFGPHPDDAALPGHGFARVSQWQVDSIDPAGPGLAATLRLEANPCTRSFWDRAFRLVYEVRIQPDGALRLRLTTQNTGSEAFEITEALHTYFGVSDVRQVEITGLAGVEYIDKVDGANRKRQGDEPIRFDRETDRVYLDTQADCVLHDPQGGRVVTVSKDGSNSTVVWNPWTAKAGRMEDFGDDEWPGMVCIETANAHVNAVTLDPGSEHVISTTISDRRYQPV